MRRRIAVLSLAVVVAALMPVVTVHGEDPVHHPSYVVMPHLEGSLALQVPTITGLWFLPAADAKEAQLRVMSTALSDVKTLTGAAAETHWASLSARGDEFLLVDHMRGTLAIPRAQIRTAYYAEDSGSPRLRLMYDGDPSGKTVDGDEATRIWAELQN